jgi:hypothetical protein
MVEVMEDTDLQMAAVEHGCHLVARFDQGLPADAGKVEGNLRGESVPGGLLRALNILERRDEGLIVRGTAEHQEVR